VISKRSLIKKILNILLLRQRISQMWRRSQSQESNSVTKIRHKKLITKTSLNKDNIFRVITSNDHVVHVEKKSSTTRWHVDKESRIMSADEKNDSCYHRGKTLKSSLRSMLKVIKGATKVTNHTIRDRILEWWTHVNVLTQLTIKKHSSHQADRWTTVEQKPQ
jgi:hypothetical protein